MAIGPLSTWYLSVYREGELGTSDFADLMFFFLAFNYFDISDGMLLFFPKFLVQGVIFPQAASAPPLGSWSRPRKRLLGHKGLTSNE